MKTIQARPIPGYPYYFASRGGSVFRYRGDGVVTPVKARRHFGKDAKKRPHTSYLIDLCVNGVKCKGLSVGSLVLWAFEGPPHSCEGTQFLDRDAVNTRVTNLQWRVYKGRVGASFDQWRVARVEKLRSARGLPVDWNPASEYSDTDVTLQVEGEFEHDREVQDNPAA